MTIAEIIRKKIYEEIVYRLRKHPFLFTKTVLIFLFSAAVPVFFYYFIAANYPALLEGVVTKTALVLVSSIYYLGIWVFFFAQFISYYLNNWIITNDRLVSITQEGLFARTISELDLYRIQDARSEIHGLFATLFNYGDVIVETAGEQEFFILKGIPDPHYIRQKLLDLAEGDRKYHVLSKT
jgi:uncharacterized membrane protein YdbT with pleckstrin-like domain